MVTSTKVIFGFASQASVAVGVAKDGVAGHVIVVGTGSAEITGAVLSSTFIVCVAVDVLPQASVAVHDLVCDLLQSPVIVPFDGVAVTVPSQ